MNKKLIGGGMAAALAIVVPFLATHEGENLSSYKDVAGVYTACYGHAYVPAGKIYTDTECKSMLKDDAIKYMASVDALIKVPVPPEVLAAHTSLAFNIGLGAYAKSKTLKLTNENDIKDGCNAILNWKYVGKKDCSMIAYNCTGIWTRRKDEQALCLSGLQ